MSGATATQSPKLIASPQEVARSVSLLPPGCVTECGIPKTERDGTVSGQSKSSADYAGIVIPHIWRAANKVPEAGRDRFRASILEALDHCLSGRSS